MARIARSVCRSVTGTVPMYSGFGRIARSRVLRLMDGCPRGLVNTTLRDGSRIRVELADYMGRPVYYFGDFDPKIIWVCRRVLMPGDVAIDIGANIGIVALQMARCVGPTGRVHAFEPQPELAMRLREDAQSNGFSQLMVHATALSDRDGSARFNVADDNCGGAGVGDRPAAGYRNVELPMQHALRAMESIDASLPVGATLRLLKIDVEGHEDVILQTLKTWLAQRRPQVILMEVSDTKLLWALPRIQTVLDLGYELFAIPRCILRMRLKKLNADAPLNEAIHDIVAIHTPTASSDAKRLLVR
jgi:FkbM family methyltransferase